MKLTPLKRSLVEIRDYAQSVADGLVRRPGHAEGTVSTVYLAAIGDFFIYLRSAAALKRAWPDKTQRLYANNLWADLARTSGYFDEVIPVEPARLRRDLRYRYQVLRAASQQPAELLLHPVVSRSSYFSSAEALVRVIPAAETWGFAETRGWRARKSAVWYSQLVPAEATHELDLNKAFINALGVDELAKFSAFNLTEGPLLEPYFVLVPGAGHVLRQWPTARFAEIAEQLSARGLKGVVCGSPDERHLADELLSQCTAELDNKAGSTDLLGYTRLIADATLVVCNDSSAAHIAASVGTPCVAVTGGGHYGRFLPYPAGYAPQLTTATYPMSCFNCNWHCIYAPDGAAPCITNITVSTVSHACQELLA